MKSNYIFSAFSITLALSGCSGGSPSSSEIENALISEAEICSPVSIEDIEKINGTKINDSTYSIDVKYTVSVEPLSGYEDFIENYKAMDIKHKQKKEELEPKIEELEEQDRTLNSELIDEERKRNTYPDFGELTPEEKAQKKSILDEENEKAINDIKIKYETFKEEMKNNPYRKEYYQNSKDWKENESNYIKTREELINKWGKDCSISGNISKYIGFSSPGKLLETVTKGRNSEFERTIIMKKTDNGWMLSK